ncbi:hypothetical protein Tco_1017022 [Tanacetum coccineum]|uniref:Uncharacterized protein n=1 Tax=Tanacetum coccineum TaxID=301880 RepID=A0ABQ5FSW5_9ASTR
MEILNWKIKMWRQPGKKEASKALVTVDGESVTGTTQSEMIKIMLSIWLATANEQDTQVNLKPKQELDTCYSNISTEPSELVSEPVVNESNIEVQPKVWSDAPIIEEYESDNDDEYVSIQPTPSFANKQVKTPRENVKNQSTHSQKPKVTNKELGHGFTERACFVCW